jgi:hypothetical protein
MEMLKAGDEEHISAMNEMQELIKSPEAMKTWFERRKREFDALPNL